MRGRVALFAVLSVACVALAVGYVGWSASQRSGEAAGADAGPGPADAAGGRIFFQNVVRDGGYAKLASVPLARPAAERAVSGRVCERLHVSAAGGICLVPSRGLVGHAYEAILLDGRLRERERVELPGLNSRARMSADGRYAAATGFVVGDSYAEGSFSTRTFLIDVRRGEALAQLEDFTVFRDGARVRSIDFNFWGVTFARDSNTFYATLGTRGTSYLVRGDVARRRLEVLHEGVECPALSPDGTRVAYKQRTSSLSWRLAVLDLRTLRSHTLAETRSVDDQPEWLDDDRVLYGLDASVWVVPSDGGGRPRELIDDALSPAVLHPTDV
jgi:hypothetical protein